MNSQIIETILNLVYFLVGLGVGVFGLWQNQKYFLAQQQDKFEQINQDLKELREHVVAIAQITSDRAFAREDRLITIAMQQQAVVDTTTAQATADIQTVIAEEMKRAGLPDAVQRTNNLQEAVSKIISESTEHVIEARQLLLGYQQEQERQNDKVSVFLQSGGDRLELPMELRRGDLTRSEILGRLGMLPTKSKGMRFSLFYLNTPEFLRQINQIKMGVGESILTILCTKDEFTQFDVRDGVMIK